jgi:hypothetical protein
MFVKVGFGFSLRYLKGYKRHPPGDDPTHGKMAREVDVDSEKMMKIGQQLAVMHFIEALIARRAAKKRGLKPMRYFCLTLVFGVFVLVPLLRKPKLDKETKKVDI